MVMNNGGEVDEACKPDCHGRQIVLEPRMYPTDVLNILTETGGFSLAGSSCNSNSEVTWSLVK